MPTPSTRKLLSEAPVGRHIAQLHKSPKTLTATVSEFVAHGLQRGEAVIVVASKSNLERYLHRLREMGVRPGDMRRSGQLIVHDTQEMLGRFMSNGMPEWAEFRATVGPVIEAVEKKKWKSTRVYGEMVNDLWRANHTGAAIRLEIYWNEIARLYRFCLLCCYELSGVDSASYESAEDAIGRTHSDMLPGIH